MRRAAIISLTLPEIPGKSGGEIRDIYLFKHIAKNYKTDYFSIHNYFGEGEINKEFLDMFENVYFPFLINEDYHNQIDEMVRLTFFDKIRYKLSLYGIYFPAQKIPAEILGFRNEFNRYIKRFFENIAREKKYDFVFISPQVNPAIIEDIYVPDNTRIIWATYDVEYIRYKRLLETKKGFFKRWFYKFEKSAACIYEKKAIQKCDGIIAVSELDREAFIKYYHVKASKVISIENGVDVEYFYELPNSNNHNIVFVGNMGYFPNDQATSYFVKCIFPEIVRKFSDAHFYAVGANASEELLALNCENVTVTGRVNDVRQYLELAGVVCVPLLAGSGTKYKVLEAMACKRAVVTTQLGSEGLNVTHNENIMIANNTEEIVEYIVELFEQNEKKQQLGEKAREFIMKNHSWSIILPKIDNWVERL